MSDTPDRFQIRQIQSVCVVVPTANVESLGWDSVEPATDTVIGPVLAKERPLVVFDLSGVAYFGSVFISLLLRCWRQVESSGGKMVVCGPTEFAQEILNKTALDTLWDIYPTLDEALVACEART